MKYKISLAIAFFCYILGCFLMLCSTNQTESRVHSWFLEFLQRITLQKWNLFDLLLQMIPESLLFLAIWLLGYLGIGFAAISVAAGCYGLILGVWNTGLLLVYPFFGAALLFSTLSVSLFTCRKIWCEFQKKFQTKRFSSQDFTQKKKWTESYWKWMVSGLVFVCFNESVKYFIILLFFTCLIK